MTRRPLAAVSYLAAAALFCVVATLNSGGYRFGVGDQAFYVPAVDRHLSPELFPRDRIVIDSQDKLTLYAPAAAAVVKSTGIGLPGLSLAVYVFALALICATTFSITRQLGLSQWAQVAAVAALTLRHRVGLTGANTLEGYMHPRMLAFAIGWAAVAAYLKNRGAVSIALVGVAAVVHPTTAMWFAVWLGIALMASDARWRMTLLPVAALCAASAIWMLTWGPFRDRMGPMDAAWLAVLDTKDYLFANKWPASMWGVAVLYVAAVVAGYLIRRSAGRLHPREPGLVAGALALGGIFVITLPFVARAVALAVQLQISRVFWMLDILGTIYMVWAVADSRRRLDSSSERTVPGSRRAMVVAAVLVIAAIARGSYVMWVEHPGRPVVETTLPQSDWQDAMNWLSRMPASVHVLADPGHAWKYGTSVRVAARRDVYLEGVKDAAIAMYSRAVAQRVAERTLAVGSFDELTPASARSLAARFDLDYLVTERSLDLPVAYRNARFSIYSLK